MRRHIFAAAVLLWAPVTASADGMTRTAPVMDSYYGPVYSHTIFTGGEVARDSWEGYLGSTWALNRDLSKEGVLFRTMGTYGRYNYDENCVLGTCPSGPQNIDGRMWQGDVMVGYQWVRSTFDVGVYAGVDFVNHRLSPNDLDNPVRGHDTGFKIALDLESHRHTGLPYFYSLEGAYSTAFDTYFLLGRLGLNRNSHIFGVEGWLLGDETGDAQRLGAFLSFDRPLRPDLLAEISLSAGYQFVDEAGRLCTSFFGSEGGYGTLNISFHFGGAAPARPMK
jgi:hypothetical protein